MSKRAHFGIGLGILVACVLWFFFGVFMFVATAVGKDSRGASSDDHSFVVIYVVFGGGLLCGLYAAFQSFRRALRPSTKVASPPTPPSQQPADVTTPDEKLAHLVKKH